MSASKDKGTRFETRVARWLTERGIPAERIALKGRADEGDVRAAARGLALSIECKDRKRIALGEWFAEAEREALNAGADMPVLVIHRQGCGPASTGANYAVVRLEDLARLLRQGTAM